MADSNRYADDVNPERTGSDNPFADILSEEQPTQSTGPFADILSEPEPDADTSFGEDVARSLGAGGGIILKNVGTLYGLATGDMENWATETGQGFIEDMRSGQSSQLKADEARRRKAIEGADSEWGKAGAALWETLSDKDLFVNFMAELLPSLIGPGALGRVALIGSRALGAGRAAQGAVGFGTTAAGGAGLAAGEVSEFVYADLVEMPDDVWAQNEEYAGMVADGVDPAQAKHQIALNLARASGGATAALSVATVGLTGPIGGQTIERVLSGAPSKMSSGALARTMTGFFGEAGQEVLEESGGQVIGNIAKQQIDPNQETFEGAGESAGLAALGGGPIGAVSGLAGGGSRSGDDIPDDSEALSALQRMRGARGESDFQGPEAEAGIDQSAFFGEKGQAEDQQADEPESPGVGPRQAEVQRRDQARNSRRAELEAAADAAAAEVAERGGDALEQITARQEALQEGEAILDAEIPPVRPEEREAAEFERQNLEQQQGDALDRTAADLGVTLPEEPDYGDTRMPKAKSDGSFAGSVYEAIDNARALGDQQKVTRLQNAQKMEQTGNRMISDGRTEAGARMQERARRIYQDYGLSSPIAPFDPANAVETAEQVQGAPPPREPQTFNQQQGRLPPSRQQGEVGPDGVIYGQVPPEQRQREQQQANERDIRGNFDQQAREGSFPREFGRQRDDAAWREERSYREVGYTPWGNPPQPVNYRPPESDEPAPDSESPAPQTDEERQLLQQRADLEAQAQQMERDMPPPPKGNQRAADVDMELQQAIASAGGLNRAEAEAQGIDPADFSRRAGGIRRVFTKQGRSFDDMAEHLSELGFFDTRGEVSPNTLLDMLSDSLGGRDVYSPRSTVQSERAGLQQGIDENEAGIAEIDRRLAEISGDKTRNDNELAPIDDDQRRELGYAVLEADALGIRAGEVDSIINQSPSVEAATAAIEEVVANAKNQSRASQGGRSQDQAIPRGEEDAGEQGSAGVRKEGEDYQVGLEEEQQDAFGGNEGQALADAARRKDERRSPQKDVPADIDGGLFSNQQDQLDIGGVEEGATEYTATQRNGSLERTDPSIRKAVEKTLKREDPDEAERIRSNLDELEGTPWAVTAIKGLAIREFFHLASEGKANSRLANDILDSPVWGKAAGQRMRSNHFIRAFSAGPRAIEAKIATYGEFIIDNKKAEKSVSTSMKNCDPSRNCAEHCYDATGTGGNPNSIIKSEATEWAAEFHPKLFADNIEDHYKASALAQAGLALRLNDKGDLSPSQIALTNEMKRRGIRMQIFSKRPDLLDKVDPFHLRMLSVDGSNLDVAEDNPDHLLAITVTDDLSDADLSQIADRAAVILPVNLAGKDWSMRELKERWPDSFPKMKTAICPVEAGQTEVSSKTSYVEVTSGRGRRKKGKKIWTCTSCDKLGTVGCFYGSRQTEVAKAELIATDSPVPDNDVSSVYTTIEGQLQTLVDMGEMTSEKREAILESIRAGGGPVQGLADGGSAEGAGAEYSQGRGPARGDDGEVRGRSARYGSAASPGQGDLLQGLDPEADPYVEAETRPGTRPEQKEAGRSALRDHFRLLNSYSERTGRGDRVQGQTESVSLLGARLYKNFQAAKPNQLVGKKAETPGDFAALAQIYRDPRFETFRYVLTKGREIVSEQAISSRLPAMVAFDVRGTARQLKDSMEAAGADGYYVLHNHPSGQADPSQQDLDATVAIADIAPGFRGHVVIDHNEYSVIKRDGTYRVVDDEDLNGVDFNSNPEQPHDVLGYKITGPSDLGLVARRVADRRRAVVIMTNSRNEVTLLTSIPKPMLEMLSSRASSADRKKGLAALRRVARASGSGGHAFVVLPEGEVNVASYEGIMEGFAADVITSSGLDTAARSSLSRSVGQRMPVEGALVDGQLIGVPRGMRVGEPTDGTPSYDINEGGFYSSLERKIAEAKIPGLTPSNRNPRGAIRAEAWLQFLRNRGIKQEEWLWTGMLELLNANPRKRYTREEMLEEARERRVELQDSVAGSNASGVEIETPDGPSWQYDLSDVAALTWALYVDAPSYSNSEVAEDLQIEGFEVTSYRDGDYHIAHNHTAGYLLLEGDMEPGNILNDERIASENEAMVRLTRRIHDAADVDDGSAQWEEYVEPGDYADYHEIKEILPGNNFDSGAHFSEKGIVGFIRATMRDDGRRYFIEELQSDLHQRGRRIGYEYNQEALAVAKARKADAEQRQISAKRRIIEAGRDLALLLADKYSLPPRALLDGSEFRYQVEDAVETLRYEMPGNLSTEALRHDASAAIFNRQIAYTHPDVTVSRDEIKAASDVVLAHRRLANEVMDAGAEVAKRSTGAIQDAPFKNDAWINMLAKRALTEAARRDADTISWMTADQMVERWSSESRELYQNVYDKKLPALMRRLTGVAATKSVEPAESGEIQQYWEAPLSPGLKNSIQREGLPLFKAADPGHGSTVEQVREWADELNLNVPFTVISRDDLPQRVRDIMKRDGIGAVSGWYTRGPGGGITLVAEGIRNKKAAQVTLLHEAVGHMGVEQVMGAQMDEFLKLVQDARGRDEVIDSFYREVERGYPDAPDVVKAAEVVAHIAERDPKHTLVQRVIQWFRQALRKMGFSVMFTSDDIVEVVRRARVSVKTGQRQNGADGVLFSRDRSVVDAASRFASKTVSDADLVPMRDGGRRNVTQSPEFRRWFGDSKVVSDDGSPLVVYRGEHSDQGSAGVRSALGSITFTSDPQAASSYAESPNNRTLAETATQSRVVPAYLSIQNPILNNQDDPFMELSDVANALGEDAAIRFATQHADWIESTNNWDERFADQHGSVAELLEADPAAVRQLYMDAYPLLDDPEFVAAAKNAGYDGAVHLGNGESMEAVEYRVFDTRQIKSATGNRGTFDPENDNILFRAEDRNFDEPSEDVSNRFIRAMQDKFEVVKRLQRNIKEAGGKVDGSNDTYLAEELFYGKAENDLRIMEEVYVESLAKTLAEHGISQAQLDEYLYARHAPERNEHIASINPRFPDGGSGMTDIEAGRILAKVEKSGKQAQFDQAAKIVYDMIQEQRNMIRRGGLEDDGLVATWEAKYENYVPLKGFAEDSKALGIRPRTGKGYDIRGKESKRALGRASRAVSPSSESIIDLTEKIVRRRKNEVGNALLKLVEDNPNPEYWDVFSEDDPEFAPKFNERTGEVVYGPIGNPYSQSDYFVTKRDGKAYFIKIKDERLKTAMENAGTTTMGPIIRTMATVNRWMSALNTSYAPEFVISNFARDIQTAMLNLQAEQSLGEAGKTDGNEIAYKAARSVGTAMRAIYRDLRGKPPAGRQAEWQKLYQEFREDGAQTGYFDSKTIEEQQRSIGRMMAMAEGGFKGGAAKWLKATADYVEDVNRTVENGVRLSAYVHARRAGVSRQKAASLAKNMTVNFNRRGEVGSTLNALYMFANASIQGTANFARTMATLKPGNDPAWKRMNRAQKIAFGLMAGTAALTWLNYTMAGDDDDGRNWYDKVPHWVRERNLVIMKSVFGGEQDGSYWKIPLPYGYNVFNVIGDAIVSAQMGDESTLQHAGRVTLAALGSFSPIGFTQSEESPVAGTMAKIFTPSQFKPIAELALNENFMNASIRRENLPFGTPQPDSSLGRQSTPAFYHWLAKGMNQATGGSEWRDGAVDVNPDVMSYLVEYYLGSAAGFVSKTTEFTRRSAQGVSTEPHRVPFLGRLDGRVLPYDDLDRFYRRRDEIGQTMEQLTNVTDPEARKAAYKDFPGHVRMAGRVKATEKQLKLLRQQRKRVYETEGLSLKEREKRLKKIEERQKAVVDRFNVAYDDAVSP